MENQRDIDHSLLALLSEAVSGADHHVDATHPSGDSNAFSVTFDVPEEGEEKASYCGHAMVRMTKEAVEIKADEITHEVRGDHTVTEDVPEPYGKRLRKVFNDEVAQVVANHLPSWYGFSVSFPQGQRPPTQEDEEGETSALRDLVPKTRPVDHNVYTGTYGEEDRRRREESPLFWICEISGLSGSESRVLVDAGSPETAATLMKSGPCEEFYCIAAPDLEEAKERFPYAMMQYDFAQQPEEEQKITGHESFESLMREKEGNPSERNPSERNPSEECPSEEYPSEEYPSEEYPSEAEEEGIALGLYVDPDYDPQSALPPDFFDRQEEQPFDAYLLGYCIHEHYNSEGTNGDPNNEHERIERIFKIHNVIREELDVMWEEAGLETDSFCWGDFVVAEGRIRSRKEDGGII